MSNFSQGQRNQEIARRRINAYRSSNPADWPACAGACLRAGTRRQAADRDTRRRRDSGKESFLDGNKLTTNRWTKGLRWWKPAGGRLYDTLQVYGISLTFTFPVAISNLNVIMIRFCHGFFFSFLFPNIILGRDYNWIKSATVQSLLDVTGNYSGG